MNDLTGKPVFIIKIHTDFEVPRVASMYFTASISEHALRPTSLPFCKTASFAIGGVAKLAASEIPKKSGVPGESKSNSGDPSRG